MTHIITVANNDSIFMGSDSRLNYFEDKVIKGEKYQEIKAYADCIQKTFFINSLNIGVQFLGIGYFLDNGEKYPLSHFINKLEEKKSTSIENSFKITFDFFKELSEVNNTGQYVKGIMSGIDGNNLKKVCVFNTFNNDFRIQELKARQFIDSEDIQRGFQLDENKIIQEIKKRIEEKSKEKWWTIGGDLTLLKINRDKSEYVLKSNNFTGSQKELIDCFNNNLAKIKGHVINPSRLEKYSF